MTADELKHIIVEAYLETGKDQTVSELAARAGTSESAVRKVLAAWPDGVAARASYSRNFRGMEAGAHRVTVYGPTRETLRKLVLDARSPRAEWAAIAAALKDAHRYALRKEGEARNPPRPVDAP